MTPELFGRVLDSVWGECNQIFVNTTGDYLSLDNHQEYSDILADRMQAGGQFVSVTTAGAFKGTPRIWATVIVCSFNAVHEEDFDRYIGIDGGLRRVVDNIRYIAASHGNVEIHSLKWVGNPDPDARLLDLFGDTTARIRVSEKVENQCRTTVTGERIPCDYLDGITINPDGVVRLCAHDFFVTKPLGYYTNIGDAIGKRNVIREYHQQGKFYELCENCNYNLETPGRIYWIK